MSFVILLFPEFFIFVLSDLAVTFTYYMVTRFIEKHELYYYGFNIALFDITLLLGEFKPNYMTFNLKTPSSIMFSEMCILKDL